MDPSAPYQQLPMPKPCSSSSMLLRLHNVVIFLLVLSNAKPTIASNTTIGLSLDLIHIDNLRSPFYIANMTDVQRVQRHVEISYNREQYWIEHSLGDATGVVSPQMTMSMYTTGIFHLHLVSVSLGTPSTNHLLVMDTGSSLIWVKCKPHHPLPNPADLIFDPHRSSTYHRVSSSDPLCDGPMFSKIRNECIYDQRYADGTFTRGALSRDKLTGRTADGTGIIPISNLAFGCGHTSGGPATAPHVVGILGMATGPHSLPMQLREVFSYCLSGNPEAFTYLRMGSDVGRVRRRHRAFASTPLIRWGTHFYVNLHDISVGGLRLRIPQEKFGSNGKCHVDSGSSYSHIRREAFELVVDAVNGYFRQRFNLRPIPDPSRSVGVNLELCYGGIVETNQLPNLVFHLEGADLVVRGVHAFGGIRSLGLTCLLVVPTDNESTLIGANQQQDIRFVYDLQARRLEFGPEDCSQDGAP